MLGVLIAFLYLLKYAYTWSFIDLHLGILWQKIYQYIYLSFIEFLFGIMVN